MDATSASAADGPGKRGSALPRPGLSRLPAPGSALPKPNVLKSPTPVNGFARPDEVPSHTTAQSITTQRRPLVAPARSKPGSQSGFALPHRTVPAPSQAPPSSYPRQALASVQARPGQHERQVSGASSTSSGSQYTRHNSLQSDYAPDGHSSEESEATAETPTSPMSSGSSLKLPKKPRQSLSDRTMDSLANVPPTPATARRRSSFFNPQSPMSPQGPPSAMEKTPTVGKINYGLGRGGIIGRPNSPTKAKPPSGLVAGTAPRRSMSTAAMPRPTSAASNMRPPSPTKRPAATSVATPGKPPGRPRPISMIGTPTSSIKSPGLAKNVAQKPLGLSRPQTQRKPLTATKVTTSAPAKPVPPASPTTPTAPVAPAAKPSAKPPPSVEEAHHGTEREATSTSSVTLRQQIAQAKAKARNAQKSLQSPKPEATPAAYDFEACEDPFGVKSNDGKDQLRKRLDDARRDGRLNISAMALPAIPDEVMTMYDAEAMEISSVPWNETVDLTRLNAAANEISELDEKIFPDVSAADMADCEDSKGNQFGGLEHIDLHGNQISQIPLGLRQLSRLTSLNLSRNRLDDGVLNIISMIPTLCDLDLSNNALAHDLPESIGRLSLLEHLNVSGNKIASLPASLRDLTRVRTLNLSHNRLQSLPFDAFVKMTTLRDLSASHNAISGALFPSSVSQLPNLRILDVSNNSLASLTFSRTLTLPALIRLDISSNRLGMFKDISEWSNLTTLLVDDNDLRECPQGMTVLTEKLRVISLERNSITSIPEEVADMDALETLNITGNPVYERKLLTLDAHGIKRNMIDKRELSKAMNAS